MLCAYYMGDNNTKRQIRLFSTSYGSGKRLTDTLIHFVLIEGESEVIIHSR